MSKRKSFFWIVVLFAAAIAGSVFYLSDKENQRNNKIEQEIAAKKREAERIKQNNFKLREKISYLETQEFEEKEAKDRLNLQKPDEQVVIIRPSVLGEEVEKNESVESEEIANQTEIPNYEKWWRYFFEYTEN